MIFDIPKPTEIESLRNLWKEAFGDTDEFLDVFFNTAFSKYRCRISRVGNEVAAALYWFDCAFDGKKIAYLYAVATLFAYRGRGICRRLMENAENHLRENGYAGVILVPGSEKLFAFYEKMGYKTSVNIGEAVYRPSDETPAIRRIDAYEYARLRRKLLPAGSVIQENENLDFLSAIADFYSGDGFLLAARKEGKTLHGIELLGDCSAIGGIVRALGCNTGKFRIPNGDVPFAMFKTFGGNGWTPTYFGFAFD